MKKKIKTWGEEIWEKKIKEQNEVGIIHGAISSKANVEKQTNKIIRLMDKYVLPLIKKKGKILDVGIGPMARFSIEFAKRSYNVVGLDVSKTTLKFAKKYINKSKTNNIKLKHGDMINLNENKKYNLVFCIETFFHIPAHLGCLVLKNFNKALSKGDYALIGFFIKKEKTLFQVLFELIYLIIHKIKKIFKKGFYVTVTSYTEDELKDMLSRTGFKLEKKIGNLGWLLKKVKEVSFI
jgi:2-polyprenyl-3-methyl-5-hydroxy-6-metoxy-1,4-benzoquinol methylase